MTDHSTFQPTLAIGPKAIRPLVAEVATPLGIAAVSDGLFADDGEWGYETDGMDCPTAFGRASASFHVDGSADRAMPVHVRLALLGGAEIWCQAKGDPIVRDGRSVAWSAQVILDPRTGLAMAGHPAEASLYEHAAPPERRVLGVILPSVEDLSLEVEVRAEALRIVAEWAARHPGYVAAIYSVFLRRRQSEVEAATEAARKAFVGLSDERSDLARLARAAEGIAAQGRGELIPTLPGIPPSETCIELRGFGDAPSLDQRNLDEIVVQAPAFVHLETMDDDRTWIGIQMADGRRLAVNLWIVGKRLVVASEIDDDGND